ncbi:EamA family transporter RarD [Corynebacterium breve]|uniref:EamA family transporter RarD n=1 Tax=Corynebacterium breve TaxID=3049799 RepID=A0ABY8VBB1_9CORY|nr:EamA family transporter RarD [Corynebacterium breve]WIM66956.1 EamA family transporter RarD [Corynebacterium breve]
MIYGFLAYLIWGFFPAFFPLLKPAGAVEILSHRIVWTAVLMCIVLTVRKGWSELRRADARTWGLLVLAGFLISSNWGIYVIAVNSGHVADAALGYFINPLFSVLLGVVFLRERLRHLQVFAVGIAAVGVIWLLVFSEQPPVLALGMTITFGIYGLVKKQVKVSAQASVAAETLTMLPLALGYLTWLESSGQGTFFSEGPTHTGLMVLSGAITAAPLILYGMGAKHMNLTTIGMLQYITPTMQMLWAVFVMQEYLSTSRWVGFTIIWIAVILYLWDILHRRKKMARASA